MVFILSQVRYRHLVGDSRVPAELRGCNSYQRFRIINASIQARSEVLREADEGWLGLGLGLIQTFLLGEKSADPMLTLDEKQTVDNNTQVRMEGLKVWN